MARKQQRKSLNMSRFISALHLSVDATNICKDVQHNSGDKRMNHKRVVHGTPITPKRLLTQLAGGSFCVSYAAPEQLDQCIELVGSDGVLILDNGAFSHWRSGKGQIDRDAFWKWANDALDRCPVAVAVIPDVIEGSERQNLEEISIAVRYNACAFPDRAMGIWHMDDSLEQLGILARVLNFVGIGSCSDYDVQRQRSKYLRRLMQANSVFDYCEHTAGRRPWVHLMRGLGVFHQACRFESADSTNIARNHNRLKPRSDRALTMHRRISAKIVNAAAAAPVGATSLTTNFGGA